MEIQELFQLIGNYGLPTVIILYLLWRLDKFLTFLCAKLEKYNDELGTIANALVDVVQQLKDLKPPK